MTNTKRAFAILLTFLVIASVYPTAVPTSNGITIIQSDTQHNTSTTTLEVTAVVFDYRGFDTLGEATVLFAAATGVIVLFRRLKK